MSLPQPAGQPFSMHARGVTAFDSGQYFDCGYQFRNMLKEIRDITSSAVLFVYLQSWLSFFVILITIGSVSFFTYVGSSGSSASLNWTLVSFVVLLPSVLLLYLAFLRREAAHQDLVTVKTAMLQIYWSFEDKSSHRAVVQHLILSLISLLREYLNAQRFYSHTYPWSGITERMTVIAQTKAKQIRRADLIFRNMSQCPELQAAFERLALAKEYRSPQALRCLVRLYVVLVIPIFFGPYYAQVSDSTNRFVFVLFFAVMMHLGMVALMNASIALEDPFSTEGVDGVYCEEVFYEIEQAIGQAGLYGGSNGHNPEPSPAKATPAPQPSNSIPTQGKPGQLEVDIAALQPVPL